MKSERGGKAVVIAWLVTATYYFYQYAMRSAPAVMMPELSSGFGLSAAAVASLVGLFYYGYSPFSLVAGVAMDRLGPRRVVPVGAAAVGVRSGATTASGCLPTWRASCTASKRPIRSSLQRRNCSRFRGPPGTIAKTRNVSAGREMRGGGLEPEAEPEKMRVFAGRCCAILRRSAPFGPPGAKRKVRRVGMLPVSTWLSRDIVDHTTPGVPHAFGRSHSRARGEIAP